MGPPLPGYRDAVIQRPSHVESFFAQHPVLPVAVRTSVAAVAAWLLVMPLNGVADAYPYYAPLGAVVGVSTTVVSSIRASMQTVLALGCAACLGVVLLLAALPTPVAIGGAVGIGTVVGSWRRLGARGSWVPISALFILLIGGGAPWQYALGYLGLTAFGALVGIAVSIAVPPLRIAEIARAQEDLRKTTAEQLEEVACGLEADGIPRAAEWRERRRDLEPKARRIKDLVDRTSAGALLNWRVQRWQARVDHLGAQGRALAHLALQVHELIDFLAEGEDPARENLTLGPHLRPAAAQALRAAAEVLRTVDGLHASQEAAESAADALLALADAVRREDNGGQQNLFLAGALGTGIWRVLQTVSPRRPVLECAPDGDAAAE